MVKNTNKLGIGSILKVEFPFSKHNLYSEAVISQQDIEEIILSVFADFSNTDPTTFNRETLEITIDESKSIQFFIVKAINDIQEYKNVEDKYLKNGIKTLIVVDAQRSVLGTELCIEILKKLQKKYPRSVFIDDYDIAVRGSDIQKIQMNKKDMYDSVTSKYLEMSDEEVEAILKNSK